ncbi:hypothetical protein GCM10007100_08310 [Roseibacillus persicicus]|uniref:Uncharacterized protein n=1 Tax=Roseibacillus persicicus TaxID=454148 RepID=A0A918TEJ7_9BACT|nr:hypothetical protein GCM10007100_08310 [Roseibacillus persicicus]
MRKNYNISSRSDMRRFEKDLQKEILSSAEEGVRKKLGSTLSRQLKVKCDGRSKVTVEGPDDLIQQDRKRLS